MNGTVTRQATGAFGLAIGSAVAATISGVRAEPDVVALAAIIALLAVGNTIAWGPGPRWALPVFIGASAAALVALAAGAADGPCLVVLAVTLPPSVVVMRSRIADATEASYVWVAAIDGSAAIGAAIVVAAVAFDAPTWFPSAIAAVGLGFAAGVAATAEWTQPRAGVTSGSAGWARWTGFVWGSAGFAASAAIPSLLAIQDERWAINLQGRAMTIAGGLTIGAVSLAIGHWYHRLATSTGERRANAAGLASAIAGGLLVAAAYSTTLIGIVTVLMAAVAVTVFTVAVLDVLAWAGRTSSARLATIGHDVAATTAGYATGIVLVSGLDASTARSVVVLGALPMILAGAWAITRTRGPDRTGGRPPSAHSITGTAFVDVSGLGAGYGRVTVLHGIDLTVDPGDVLAVMGMNGVGKTTLLRTIAGLVPHSRGRIAIGGADIAGFPAAWRAELGICHVAGSDSVVPDLTVDENLSMFTHGDRIDPDEFSRRRAAVFATFPILGERSSQRSETLSGGERQMLALAKAVMQRPRLLLIDEFSLGLAPTVVDQLIPTVRDLTADGTPTILVEQNVDTALALATRVVVLDKGRVTWRGDADVLAADADLISELFVPPVGAELG